MPYGGYLHNVNITLTAMEVFSYRLHGITSQKTVFCHTNGDDDDCENNYCTGSVLVLENWLLS
jgi:hypothetical protein